MTIWSTQTFALTTMIFEHPHISSIYLTLLYVFMPIFLSNHSFITSIAHICNRLTTFSCYKALSLMGSMSLGPKSWVWILVGGKRNTTWGGRYSYISLIGISLIGIQLGFCVTDDHTTWGGRYTYEWQDSVTREWPDWVSKNDFSCINCIWLLKVTCPRGYMTLTHPSTETRRNWSHWWRHSVRGEWNPYPT